MNTAFIPLMALLIPFSALAAECETSGSSEVPQGLHCVYRDGWYIRNFLDLTCLEGKYEYTLSTKQGVYEKDTAIVAYDATTGQFVWRNRDGVIMRVQKNALNRFSGTRVFPGSEELNETVHCREI